MEKFKAFCRRWWDRIVGAATVGQWLPAGLFALAMSYLSTGVSWINRFGLFGWASTGLIVFVLSSVAIGLLGRARLWRAESKARERLTSNSSPFDPMEKVFRDKRLFLKDLAPLGRKEIKGRKFINCEIVGPGDIVIDMRSDDSKPFPTMRDNWFNDVNLIHVAVAEGKTIHNAVFFPDCDFEGCQFYSLNALFAHRLNENLNWITAPAITQPALPSPAPKGITRSVKPTKP